LFHSSANLYAVSIAFSITFYISITTATALTGGWTSPVVPLLLCTPVIVFLISGWREAEYAVLLTLATGMVFMVLDLLLIKLPQFMHEENRPYALGVVWLLACTILLLLFANQKWVQGIDDNNSSNFFRQPISDQSMSVQPTSAQPVSVPDQAFDQGQ
jgi:membrane protein CcdC involved in cytochrome C biogenesis